MIHSMTGFSQARADLESGWATWELRSVNHRYLEISPRLPEGFRYLEPMIREIVGHALRRGKVDVSLRFGAQGEGGRGLELDHELVHKLIKMGGEVARELGTGQDLSAGELLQWPGVVRTVSLDPERIQHRLRDALEAATEGLVMDRQREGKALLQALVSRIEALEGLVERICDRLPEVRKGLRERLEWALADLGERLEPDRLEQELVLQIQRRDVDEEVDRLKTHQGEVRRILEKGGPVGRRLDFLLQEMNREANTIGSKVPDAHVSQAGVEVKVVLEQMREQAQNVE